MDLIKQFDFVHRVENFEKGKEKLLFMSIMQTTIYQLF